LTAQTWPIRADADTSLRERLAAAIIARNLHTSYPLCQPEIDFALDCIMPVLAALPPRPPDAPAETPQEPPHPPIDHLVDDYAVAFKRDVEDRIVYAWCPDLPGCLGHGDTILEALACVTEGKRDWLAMVREGGQTVPEPMFDHLSLRQSRVAQPASGETPPPWTRAQVLDRAEHLIHLAESDEDFQDVEMLRYLATKV
jgi:predicted RNase H-like HicB family nuclease